METLQFKTNINCGNCIKKVSPFLNKIEEVENWKVDTDNPDKILTISGDELSIEAVCEAVAAAGFDIKVLV